MTCDNSIRLRPRWTLRLLTFATALAAAAWHLPAQAGLLAHWKLNEPVGTTGAGSVKDATGYHNDGTPKGTNVFGDPGANANTGTAVDVGPVNPSGIDMNHHPMMNPTSFTVTAWARKDGAHVGGFGSVITSRLDLGGTNQNGYIIYNNPSGVWEFWSGDGNGGGNWQVLGSGVTATIGAWTHLAISYDAASQTKQMFINGVQMGGNQVVGLNPNFSAQTHIGVGADPGNQFTFNGPIDDVSVWDRALTPAEISSLMTGGVPAPPAPTPGVIEIINSSFEDTSVAPSNAAFQAAGIGRVTGWKGLQVGDSANTGSQPNAPTASAAPVNFTVGIDGLRVGHVNNGAVRSLVQDTAAEFVDGNLYTLTVGVGRRKDHDDLGIGAADWQISLNYVDDGSPVAFLDGSTVVGNGGVLSDFSVSYLATVDDVGRRIQVRLTNRNTAAGFNAVNFDNVRLTYTPVPEPSSLILAGLGLAMLVFGLRTRRGK